MADATIKRIRTGGQTGVDRAALDAAIEAGVPHGGWCPADRRAEDGRIPPRYRLAETGSTDYADRTRLNVEDADGTLILTAPEPRGGTLLTLQAAMQSGKPVFLTDPRRGFPRKALAAWLCVNAVAELNVAGPRGSASEAVYRNARRFMTRLLAEFSSPSRRSSSP